MTGVALWVDDYTLNTYCNGCAMELQNEQRASGEDYLDAVPYPFRFTCDLCGETFEQ